MNNISDITITIRGIDYERTPYTIVKNNIRQFISGDRITMYYNNSVSINKDIDVLLHCSFIQLGGGRKL